MDQRQKTTVLDLFGLPLEASVEKKGNICASIKSIALITSMEPCPCRWTKRNQQVKINVQNQKTEYLPLGTHMPFR